MRAILLIDFGSTFTKLTAVDLDTPCVLGGAQAFTTAGTDISLGLAKALERLDQSTGPVEFDARLACSSAAGGLNMVASGLVPGLTSKAARMAAFGAGAKVIKTYAYKLTEDDILEINRVRPDILLLCGGIDGGNSEVILHNAARVAGAAGDFPVLVAGNRNAQEECAALLADSGHPVYTAPNVMPEMNTLNIEPAAEVIRQIFLKRIILAKGLNRAERLLDGIMMPTPAAVLKAMRLLSRGQRRPPGWATSSGWTWAAPRRIFIPSRAGSRPTPPPSSAGCQSRWPSAPWKATWACATTRGASWTRWGRKRWPA